MPVVKIHCPQCQDEFIDSRVEREEEVVARCPKCGTNITAHTIDSEPASVNGHGRVVHAEPIVAMPLDRAH